MFRFNANMSSTKSAFQAAHARLPKVHHAAATEAFEHLRSRAAQTAEDAGQDSSPIQTFWNPDGPYLGIDHSTSQGQVLRDVEYGGIGRYRPDGQVQLRAEDAPNPVLRTAVRKAAPEAEQIFRSRLWGGIGL